MKKKILTLSLVVALAATAIIGGTLAYFTDEDAETNTFTVGNIDIELEEKFEQNSELMPGIDVDKDAKITNTGENTAWVWAEILIPSSLDDADDNSPTAPGLGNSLHFNYPGENAAEYAQKDDPNGKFYNKDMSGLWIMKHNEDGLKYGFAGTETIGSVTYNKFICFYTEKLEAEESTTLFLDKVYMDGKVTQCTNEDHENCFVLADGETHYTGTWEIIVRAYGIQEAGFDNVIAAWKAYDGK